MAVLQVLTYPDPRLKQVAALVNEFDHALQRFLDDLEDTLSDGPGAVGIAAPQVGRLQRIAIVDVSSVMQRAGAKRTPVSSSNGRLFLINPEVVERQDSVIGREGCLSVPDYTGNVERAGTIRLRALDREGCEQEYLCSGYEARAVQHELDHLDGLLFLDRLVSPRELFRRKVYQGGA